MGDAQMSSFTINIALGMDSCIDVYDEIKALSHQAEKNIADVFAIIGKLKKTTVPMMPECKGNAKYKSFMKLISYI